MPNLTWLSCRHRSNRSVYYDPYTVFTTTTTIITAAICVFFNLWYQHNCYKYKVCLYLCLVYMQDFLRIMRHCGL